LLDFELLLEVVGFDPGELLGLLVPGFLDELVVLLFEGEELGFLGLRVKIGELLGSLLSF
jgi:hypothetical protein